MVGLKAPQHVYALNGVNHSGSALTIIVTYTMPDNTTKMSEEHVSNNGSFHFEQRTQKQGLATFSAHITRVEIKSANGISKVWNEPLPGVVSPVRHYNVEIGPSLEWKMHARHLV